MPAGRPPSTAPTSRNELTESAAGRRAEEVDRELAPMDSQITEAYQRSPTERDRSSAIRSLAENAILSPLKDKRPASIDRISIAIGRDGQKPQGMDDLAPCAAGR